MKIRTNLLSGLFFYTVKVGDSLSSIAYKVYGDAYRWPEIYNNNKKVIGNNPEHLEAGITLKLNDK